MKNVASSPPLWTVLSVAPKAQHLVTLQDALDGATATLATPVVIVATPALLKRLLGFQLSMEDRVDLTTGSQPFTLIKYTTAVQKALVARAARHALIVSGGAMLSLANYKTLTATNSTTIPSTFVLEQDMITRLFIVAAAIFGVNHSIPSSAGNFVDKMVAREN